MSLSNDHHHVADVVVIGSGATGLPAAIVAREAGASVIVVEAEADIGGHAITSGGNVPLGGGTSVQRKHGIADSPELLFRDLTDWSIVEPNGFPDYRYNDREIVRAFAEESAATFEWLVAHGVVFVDKAPDARGGNAVGNSVPREMHAAAMAWPLVQTGRPVDPRCGDDVDRKRADAAARGGGAARRACGMLLEHRMTAIHRETRRRAASSGSRWHAAGEGATSGAQSAVIIATGGSTGNVEFRRMFDPRLTEEYCGLAGMPWSDQDASGELAAMAVGASLWGLTNQAGEFGWPVTKPGLIGCQYNYSEPPMAAGQPVFHKARASGLRVKDWQNVILVNMLGRRFYDETGAHFTSNNYGSVDPYEPLSYRNAENIAVRSEQLAQRRVGRRRRNAQRRRADLGDLRCGGRRARRVGPDSAARRCRGRILLPARHGRGARRSDRMPYQRMPMPPAELRTKRWTATTPSSISASTPISRNRRRATRSRRPPFYAAWATPVIHDSRAGLRINANCQVDRRPRPRSSRDSIAAANRPAVSASTASPARCAKASSPPATRRLPPNALDTIQGKRAANGERAFVRPSFAGSPLPCRPLHWLPTPARAERSMRSRRRARC